jgi:hypothetical protein
MTNEVDEMSAASAGSGAKDIRTDDATLVRALLVLSRDIHSDDGVANACIREAANRLEELTQWIPAEQRLPKSGVTVIGWRPGLPHPIPCEWNAFKKGCGWDYEECWTQDYLSIEPITHWQPVPLPPLPAPPSDGK